MPRKPSTSPLLPTLGLLVLSGGLGVVFNFIGHWHTLSGAVPEFIALSLAAGALYVIGVYIVERFILGPSALLVIVLGALFFRLCLLPREPAITSDVYRYQWEGRVERLHINPYIVYPALPALSALEDSRRPIETGRTVSTCYPPLSEWSFSWVSTVAGYKSLYTGFDLAALGVLAALLVVSKQPLHRLLTYAWNPCVLISFAMCGHHDSLAIFTLLVAILLIILHKPALSLSFLALSVISKFFSVLLLPALVARASRPLSRERPAPAGVSGQDGRPAGAGGETPTGRGRLPAPRDSRRARPAYAALFVAIVGLSYLPFLSAGRRLFKGLSDYAAGWEGNDSLFRLIQLAGNSKAQGELVAGALVLILVAYALRRRLEPLSASLLLISGLLFLSPNAFPWYFTWIIPFLCFYPRAPLLLMSIASVLGYAPVVAYAAGQPYRDSTFILLLEYAPVLAWLAYQGCRALVSSDTLLSTTPL
jgi:hypothetical protein